jgi:DNA-binding phage protein
MRFIAFKATQISVFRQDQFIIHRKLVRTNLRQRILTATTRESLYRALALGKKPRYDTVLTVLRALGVKLNVESVHV